MPSYRTRNVAAPMLPSPAKLPMQAQVDLMKSLMVQRVSNADRARYALRATPNAHQRKDQTIKIPLQKRRNSTRGWARSEYRSDRPRPYRTEGPVNLDDYRQK